METDVDDLTPLAKGAVRAMKENDDAVSSENRSSKTAAESFMFAIFLYVADSSKTMISTFVAEARAYWVSYVRTGTFVRRFG